MDYTMASFPFTAFFVTMVSFLILDTIYFSLMYTYMNEVIAKLQRKPLVLRYTSALVCYLAMTVLFMYFIVLPKRTIREAFFLGLLVYLIYETTNYAILKDWPLTLVWIDSLWGGILFMTVAFINKIFGYST
jgi:uncharacterized membrane protein